MFRILAVDDDPMAQHLLKEIIKPLRNQPELHFARDGMEALDCLYGRGSYGEPLRPDLILLDMNMPRLNGLETLAAIKGDPALCAIPVIVLSCASDPKTVRLSYQAHANCYVLKPPNLSRAQELIAAIESFWMEFALRSGDTSSPRGGRRDAAAGEFRGDAESAGTGSRPSPIDASATGEKAQERRRVIEDYAQPSAIGTTHHIECKEKRRLLEEFASAVTQLVELHEHQFLALVERDDEPNRFDLLIHMAGQRKQQAKYDFIRHTQEHDC
jgi:two-component system, chemotaxis family, response regulator Rcp1